MARPEPVLLVQRSLVYFSTTWNLDSARDEGDQPASVALLACYGLAFFSPSYSGHVWSHADAWRPSAHVCAGTGWARLTIYFLEARDRNRLDGGVVSDQSSVYSLPSMRVEGDTLQEDAWDRQFLTRSRLKSLGYSSSTRACKSQVDVIYPGHLARCLTRVPR